VIRSQASTAAEPPTVSVVCVALDSERTIRRTIESVLAQTSRPDEFILIDGGSRDRTLAIAREYSASFTATESRSDTGIYDAMNRGLERARGEVIGFLNSNDVYADEEVVACIRRTMRDPQVDACYGHLDFVNRSGRTTRRWRTTPFSRGLLDSGWVPPHPTFYCRRKLLVTAGGFKSEYRIAGDYELFIRLLAVTPIRMHFIPKVLVKMEAGGISNASLGNILAANREVVKAWKENGLPPPSLIRWRKPLSKLAQLRPPW
jgi:glycosyltransferase